MSYNQYDNNIDIAILTSEITNNTNNMADVTGLSLPMMANTSYEFECEIIWRINDTGRGIRFSINGPESPTLVLLHTEISNGLSSIVNNIARAYNSGLGSTDIDAANTNSYARCYGFVTNGSTAGNLQLRFSRSGGTGTIIYVEPGTIMRMWRTNPSN